MRPIFPPTSRYHGIETGEYTGADGRTFVYLRRRFLPFAEAIVVATQHVVTEGERLDNITWQYLGDPEQFWRLCDANDATHPRELTAEIGRALRIPLVQGL